MQIQIVKKLILLTRNIDSSMELRTSCKALEIFDSLLQAKVGPLAGVAAVADDQREWISKTKP